MERKEERRYLAGQGAGGQLSTQLEGPWKLQLRRLGEQGVMGLKGTTANSHKSTETQGPCLQRAACYGLQGFIARLGAVGFCVPCLNPGEGVPMCPEGVFFCVCSVLKFITAAGVEAGVLKQSGRIAWPVTSEWLLMVGFGSPQHPSPEPLLAFGLRINWKKSVGCV